RLSERRSLSVFCGAFFCVCFGLSEPFAMPRIVPPRSLSHLRREHAPACDRGALATSPVQSDPVPGGVPYRWIVLGVGTAAQASVSAALIGVPVLAPQLRAHFGLSLGETGVVLAALSIGMTPTLLAWGLLADRVGERVVLPLGLAVA